MVQFFRFLFTLTCCPPLISQGETPPVLKSFPLKESLWLSMSKSHITPSQTIALRSSLEGYLQINAPNHSLLQKDQVWAIKNPKRLKLSQTSLDLEKIKSSQKIKTIKLDYQDSISTQEDTLAALIIEQKKLQSALTSPEITQNSKITQPLQNALKKISAGISRASQRLENLNSETPLQTEISQINLDLEKKRANHELLQKSSEYEAPFQGTLNLQIPDLLETTQYPVTVWVNSSEPLGTLSNNKRFEVSIKASSSALFQVNSNTLFIKINSHRKKQTITANYFRTQQLESQSPNTPPVLVFQVSKKDTIKAQDLSGGQPLANIYTKLPKNCHIVPKATLLPYLNQQEDQSNWKETTERLWPNSKLIAIGKTALAVQAISN